MLVFLILMFLILMMLPLLRMFLGLLWRLPSEHLSDFLKNVLTYFFFFFTWKVILICKIAYSFSGPSQVKNKGQKLQSGSPQFSLICL